MTDPHNPSGTSADALVVGGGPGGLSAALYLARYNRSVLVFDTGHGRSTRHQTNHNYLGFPDGIATVGLRELARRQLARYDNIRFVHHHVTQISGDAEQGFVAGAQGGHAWHGRVVVLATGVLDHFPHFPGWEQYVGRSMFWCITCDGYENRGRDILVVGHTDAAAGEAMQLHSLMSQRGAAEAGARPRHHPCRRLRGSTRRGAGSGRPTLGRGGATRSVRAAACGPGQPHAPHR